MPLRYDRESYERRVAVAMRGDAWAGARLCSPQFHIWGTPVLPQSRLARLKGQLHHAGLRRVVVSAFGISTETVRRDARRYNALKPTVVIGYTNAVYEFARCAREQGLSLHPPRGVVCSAEKLFPYQRELIEQVFGAPVFDRYGSREVMLIGAECERHEGLHASIDQLHIEIVKDGRPCAPGEVGEVLLTDLHNYGMPLIRYRVGDLAAWKGRPCSCGRGLPLLQEVQGRVLDVIRTPDGRSISGALFPHLLKDFAGVGRYQVIQEKADELRVRIRLERPLAPEESERIQRALLQVVGPTLRLVWEIGEDVVIERRGKFRPVINQVPLEATP